MCSSETKHQLHAKEVARSLDITKYDGIVCVSGDGILVEVSFIVVVIIIMLMTLSKLINFDDHVYFYTLHVYMAKYFLLSCKTIETTRTSNKKSLILSFSYKSGLICQNSRFSLNA